MANIKGIDILLEVNTGTAEVPTWTKIGGQRGCTLNLSAETLETTSKDSEGFREYEQSFKEWSIEADGLFVTNDAGFNALEQAFMQGTKVLAHVAFPSGAKYEGLVIVTELPIEAPYDDVATYTVTLTGCGSLEKVTA